MAYKNKIHVKTDASTRDGCGCGLAYEVNIFDQFSVKEVHCGKSFIQRRLTSTKSETLAVLFALKQINTLFNNARDDYKKDYDIIIKSDCEHTIRRLENEDYCSDDDMNKFLEHYGRLFKDCRAMWIPRSENTKVDAMAREMFRRGAEGEL